jgi:hypothetical protein
MMVILNIVLMSLIAIGTVGFLAWSIVTEHRRYGCADLRFGRDLSPMIKLVSPVAPELGRAAGVAPQM